MSNQSSPLMILIKYKKIRKHVIFYYEKKYTHKRFVLKNIRPPDSPSTNLISIISTCSTFRNYYKGWPPLFWGGALKSRYISNFSRYPAKITLSKVTCNDVWDCIQPKLNNYDCIYFCSFRFCII